MEKNNVCLGLIKDFNAVAGTRFRGSVGENVTAVAWALKDDLSNLADLKQHIGAWVNNNRGRVHDKDALTSCFYSYEKKEVAVPEVVPAQVTDQQVNYSMGILEQAVVGLIANTNTEKIEKSIFDSLGARIDKFINDNYGHIERRVDTIINGVKFETKETLHEKFSTVLSFVANDIPVYLYGPAGSGKNHLCKQVADALGLDFYFSNAVTQEHKITGFTDANGRYQPTPFYKAFTEGGLFMLDEMDASVPEALILLNAAIANGYFDFPAPIGMKKAHPNFKVIAAGNTLGLGADSMYTGRYQLDASTLNRFATVEILYSPEIEMAVSGYKTDLVEFCRAFRNSVRENGMSVVVSYRQISMLAKMEELLSLEEALSTCLLKGMEKDDIVLASNNLPDSKYASAIKKVAASM